LVQWLLMGGLLHLVQQGGGLGGLRPRPVPSSLYQCNSPPITVLLYDGLLICGFNVAIKGLNPLFSVGYAHLLLRRV